MSFHRLRGTRGSTSSEVLDLDASGRLVGRKTASARRSGASEEPLSAPIARALLEAMRLLVRSVAPSEPSHGALVSLEEAAARARLPEDYRQVAEALAATTLDPIAAHAPAPDGIDVTRFFHQVVCAARPIAQALALGAADGDLAELAKIPVLDAEDERPLKRLFRAFETFALTAGQLREGNALVKRCVVELIDTLARLGAGEDDTRTELDRIVGRLRAAEDVRDLETLRGELLAQASSLVEAAAGRAAAVEQAVTAARASQARAEELEAALTEVEVQARTDALTGLDNRHALEAALGGHAAAGAPVGVLAVDLDHFKAINDGHGHAAGDAVLRHVADLVRRELRGRDEAYRVGGEELLVLLPGSDWQGARATAERLRRRIEEEPVTGPGGLTIGVTASIGVALWPSGEPFGDALAMADRALYRAKAAGRNRVVG